jgi:tRNA (mo5U34)-methyltransferase
VSKTDQSPAEVQARLDDLLWYHSVDVMPGVATKGWWDLRHALPLIPFPDVRGKRCLDIGTWDGFYAYEMEKRGAAEVVAIDVADLSGIDYPPEVRADKTFDPSHKGKQERSAGFRLLHEILDSKVEWRDMNVYDLDPALVGQFDVVVLGSLLVHLRDPVRALDAVRSVTRGEFVCIDYILPTAQLLSRGKPVFILQGGGRDFQWWEASEPGLQRLLYVGGFDIEQKSPFFLLKPGPRTLPIPAPRLKDRARQAVFWAYSRDVTHGGHLHRAYRCRPRF